MKSEKCAVYQCLKHTDLKIGTNQVDYAALINSEQNLLPREQVYGEFSVVLIYLTQQAGRVQ